MALKVSPKKPTQPETDLAASVPPTIRLTGTSVRNCLVCKAPNLSPMTTKPCGHTICSACGGTALTTSSCPYCRNPVTNVDHDFAKLALMKAEVTGTCAQCSWNGSYDAALSHRCGSLTPPALSGAAADTFLTYLYWDFDNINPPPGQFIYWYIAMIKKLESIGFIVDRYWVRSSLYYRTGQIPPEAISGAQQLRISVRPAPEKQESADRLITRDVTEVREYAARRRKVKVIFVTSDMDICNDIIACERADINTCIITNAKEPNYSTLKYHASSVLTMYECLNADDPKGLNSPAATAQPHQAPQVTEQTSETAVAASKREKPADERLSLPSSVFQSDSVLSSAGTSTAAAAPPAATAAVAPSQVQPTPQPTAVTKESKPAPSTAVEAAPGSPATSPAANSSKQRSQPIGSQPAASGKTVEKVTRPTKGGTNAAAAAAPVEAPTNTAVADPQPSSSSSQPVLPSYSATVNPAVTQQPAPSSQKASSHAAAPASAPPVATAKPFFTPTDTLVSIDKRMIYVADLVRNVGFDKAVKGLKEPSLCQLKASHDVNQCEFLHEVESVKPSFPAQKEQPKTAWGGAPAARVAAEPPRATQPPAAGTTIATVAAAAASSAAAAPAVVASSTIVVARSQVKEKFYTVEGEQVAESKLIRNLAVQYLDDNPHAKGKKCTNARTHDPKECTFIHFKKAKK